MKTDTLLDPGKCPHPGARLVYLGMQENVPGKPAFALFTCQDCGTTIAGKQEAIEPKEAEK